MTDPDAPDVYWVVRAKTGRLRGLYYGNPSWVTSRDHGYCVHFESREDARDKAANVGDSVAVKVTRYRLALRMVKRGK